METLSESLALCDGNPSPVEKACILGFNCLCLPKKAVKQTVELLVIWNTAYVTSL